MSTLIDSYRQAYAAKNQALTQKLNVKLSGLKSKQKQEEKAAAEDMRQAYAQHMRALSQMGQQSRSDGLFSGAADNALTGEKDRHEQSRSARQNELRQTVEDIRTDMASARSDTAKKIADNNTALEQKVASQQAKEETAAQKAAASAAKSALSAAKSAASNANKEKSRVLSLMRMGIYDASFAGILGISDREVRDYLWNVHNVNVDAKQGTKQPLR